MSAEEYVEEKGIGDALSKVGAGFVIMLIACGGMFWNEWRYVNRSQDLSWGKKNVQSVDSSEVDSEADGELVHTSGEAEAETPLRDEMFSLEMDGLKLERTAEMYQWEEEVEEKDDKKIYRYERVWSEMPINSDVFNTSKFKKHLRKTGSHPNPDEMTVDGETFVASDATLDAYKLPGDLLEKLPTSETFSADSEFVQNLPPVVQKRNPSVTNTDDGPGICIPFKGHDQGCGHEVGDVRVSWSYEPEGTVSLYAGLNGETFESFSDKALHGELYRITTGKKSAKAMFEAAQTENWMLLWALRLGGIVFMIMGVSFLFAPIDFLADYIPILGELVDTGTNLIAGAIGLAFSFIAIALGWITARPLIGILLLMVAMGAIAGAVFLYLQASSGPESDSQAPA